jgi:hypothetical protein
MAFLYEDAGEHAPDVGVVVYDQDASHVPSVLFATRVIAL